MILAVLRLFNPGFIILVGVGFPASSFKYPPYFRNSGYLHRGHPNQKGDLIHEVKI
jgi:hypothetical protein